MQALGQIILLLMKHTDFSDVDSSHSDQISDLVQNCSFTFGNWQQVIAHPVLQESFLDSLPARASSKDLQEERAGEFSGLDMVPLQESTIIANVEDGAAAQ